MVSMPSFAAKICLQDLCVTLHGVRGFLADLLAEVDDCDPIGIIHDQADVMADQYEGNPGLPYLPTSFPMIRDSSGPIPAVGSSRMRRFGSLAKERAI